MSTTHSPLRAKRSFYIPKLFSPKTTPITGESGYVKQETISFPVPKPEPEDFGFLELAAGADPTLDIVAIHGLDGHRKTTWMAENGKLWLQDFLPADLPNARVLTYGYDANTCNRGRVSTQTIRTHAEKFLQELSRKRQSAPRRPIVFVAHSLGGIILKQALVNSDRYADFCDILPSTHGVLFFGTPHSGANGVKHLQILNKLRSLLKKTTNNLLRHLEPNSDELENLQMYYQRVSEGFETVCFYEEYPTPTVWGRREMIVPRHAATLVGDRKVTREVLHGDHCEMVKFSDSSRSDYQAVLSYLVRWMKEVTGNVVDNTYPSAPQEEPPLVPKLINIPKPVPPGSRVYIRRPKIQSRMDRLLVPNGRRTRQPRCILYGAGGAGKTQLATTWIKEHKALFNRVIVVDASSRRQLEVDLQREIRMVGPEYAKSTWEDAIAYLNNRGGWLLFLDNADFQDFKLDPYLPSSPHGAVLIATRNHNCRNYEPDGAIPVEGLTESEAIELLHTTANIKPASIGASLKIVREIGTLPLAVAQAGAYIFENRRFDSYLATLRERRYQLLREGLLKGTKDSHSAYAAFDLSFRQLPIKAQKLLKIFACFHHTRIPMALFEEAIASGFAPRTGLRSCPPPEGDETIVSNITDIICSPWDERSFQALIDAAQSASFIDTITDTSGSVFYTIHPLLQRYIQDSFGEQGIQYKRMAARILLGVAQRPRESNSWYWQLVPHIDALPQTIKEADLAHTIGFHQVYKSLGFWKDTRKLLKVALSKLQDMHGRAHQDSVRTMGWLAEATRHCGQLEDAQRLEREALAMRIELLRQRHPGSIATMANLANTLQTRRQWEEAVKLQRDLLDMCIEHFGQDHADTITAMHGLADTLRARAQWEEYINSARRALRVHTGFGGYLRDSLTMRTPDSCSSAREV